MQENKIIIGYDSADTASADALRLGRELAGALHARPLITTALPWPQYLLDPAEIDMALVEHLAQGLRGVAQELTDVDPEVDGPETRVVSGPTAASALEDLAVAEQAAVVVVGSCRLGSVGRTLAGSVGESLLHGASCAVAVAPRGYGEHALRPFRRIAVAFDGSPEGWTALETGIGLAVATSADLTVLAVAEYPRYSYATPWSAYAMRAVREAEHANRVRLLDLARARVGDDLACETRLLDGEPGMALVGASADFDLMLTGSRGWGPLRRVLLGSTSRRLISDSACPVLVLPRGVGVDPLGLGRRNSARTPATGSASAMSAPTLPA